MASAVSRGAVAFGSKGDVPSLRSWADRSERAQERLVDGGASGGHPLLSAASVHRSRDLGREAPAASASETADRLVGGPDAVLVVDDATLPKSGDRSVGVALQLASALRKTANCQTLDSVTLAGGEIPVTVGLTLFLPESWTGDPNRMARAGVHEEQLAARNKLEFAIAEGDQGFVKVVCASATCRPRWAMAAPRRSGRP